MPIIPWRRFDDLDRFFGEDFPSPFLRERELVPPVNIYETEKEVVAEMSVPGMKPDNIEVTVSNGILRVKGESKEEKEERDKGYWRREIRSGSFERAFHLPVSVNDSAANAEMKDGVLKITIPRLIETKTEGKKIKVKSD